MAKNGKPSFIIPPVGIGRHTNYVPHNLDGIGRDKHFISKEEAMTSPEKMERYKKQMEGARRGNEQHRKNCMERKKMKEALNGLMSANYEELQDFLQWDFKTKGNVIPDKVKAWFEERGVEVTVQDAVLLSALKNAVYRGDLRSIEFIRDTLGEKPKIEVEQNANIVNVQGFTDLANALYGEEENKDKKED